MITAWHQQDPVEKLPKQPETKRCCECKKTHHISLFWRDRSRDDGFERYCIPCRKADPLYARPRGMSQAAKNKQRARVCHERLAFWTNELNKAQKDGM